MTKRSWKIVLGFCVAIFSSAANVRGDGGHLRLVERAGVWRVAAFTSPTPLRVGLIDVSVLVEDTKGNVASDVAVLVTARHEASGTVLLESATEAAAVNKLFRSALCRLPYAGQWEFTVSLANREGAAEQLMFAADVLEAAPPWTTQAPLLAWPLLPIGLFAVHQFLVSRKAHRTSRAA